jgi:DNA-binding NarL/FixJ family response regulator
MGGRVRPSGTVNVPTEAEVEETRRVVEASLRDLSEAADSVLLRLSRIHNPVERAKAALEVRRFSAADLTSVSDGLFRDAVIEAYAAGRAEHGWYGYGALAEDLGLSRARVQQIVTGTWKKDGEKESDRVAAIRQSADTSRAVRRMAAAGYSAEQIADDLKLSVPAVRDLMG